MNELRQLILLMQKPKPVTGVVSSTDGVTMLISTSKGIVQVSDKAGYKKGDTVLMRNGEIVGKILAESQLPIYYV